MALPRRWALFRCGGFGMRRNYQIFKEIPDSTYDVSNLQWYKVSVVCQLESVHTLATMKVKVNA